MLSDTAAAGYNAAGQYQQVANFEHYHSYQQHLQNQQHQQAPAATAQAYQHSPGPQLIMHQNQHFQQQHVRDVSSRSSTGSVSSEPVSGALGSGGLVAAASTHPFHPAAAIQTHQQHPHANQQYHQYHHQRHHCQEQQPLAAAYSAAHLQTHPHAATIHQQAHQHAAHAAHAQQPLAGHQHAQQFQFHPHLGHPSHHLHHHHPTIMATGAANSSTSPYGHPAISSHNHTPPSQYSQQEQQPQQQHQHQHQHQQYPAVTHYTQQAGSNPQHNTYGHAHTTPPFSGQPAGSMLSLGSPNDPIGQMSPVLMKPDSVESRSAIPADHMDQCSKKEGQIDQLHQRCASLLDEQQGAGMIATGASQHLMSSNPQQPASKLGPSDLISASQTPTSTKNNNNTATSDANNSNANSANARPKRPPAYGLAARAGHNRTSPSQYAHHQEQQLQHQQHSAASHYAQHLNSQAQHNSYRQAQSSPPFGVQASGSMVSPGDAAQISPGLMKQEPAEARLAIHTDQALKGESQLEQLHQQCASLLDEQQRVPLVSTGGAQHAMPANLQHADSKLNPNDSNSGSQTPTSTNNNNNNSANNSSANNSNTNGRSKRLRTSFKHHQLKEMKKWFSKNQNPDAKDLKTLAQTTGLSKRVLQVWFQNARAKFRRNNAKAVNQQLQYSVNQHTSHMLQFQQQQQAPHHPMHTYGQQHHLNQHTLISSHHHHHHHNHHQQQLQSHQHGPAVSSANVVVPVALPTAVHTTPSESSDHNTLQLQQASVQPPQTQSQIG